MGMQLEGLYVSICTIDGRRHQFVQTDTSTVDGVLELLRRNKIFGQENLSIVADGGLSIFPSHTVSRLDISAGKLLTPICAPTFTETWEITQEEYAQRHEQIAAQVALHRPPEPMNHDLGMLHTIDLLGEHRLYLLSHRAHDDDRPRPEISTYDLSGFLRRAMPPAMTIGRRDGGLTFLNTANVLRTTAFPCPPESSPSLLMYSGRELSESERGL